MAVSSKMRPSIVLVLLVVYTKTKRARRDQEDDDAVDPKVDVVSTAQRNPVYVPFGHIFRDGVEDPNSDFKQPVDFLELSLRTPQTWGEREKFLKEVPPHRILKINKDIFKNHKEDPREAILAAESARRAESTNKTDRDTMWFDFEAIHVQKMANPRPVPVPPGQKPANVTKELKTPMLHDSGNGQVFGYGLDLRSAFATQEWTNCEEFAKGSSYFHPKDIVDIDWTPFYIWSARKSLEPTVHRFTYPTKKLVKEYKSTYAPHMNATLDWEQPKLILNESIEMLLIADVNDRRGLFHGIPKRRMPKEPDLINLIKLIVPKIRLKIEDPYLAMMFCEEYYATIMASPGNEPANDDERTEEAGILNFKGSGYPVSRDLEAEEAARRVMMQREREEEEMKYIRAFDIGADMNLDKESVF